VNALRLEGRRTLRRLCLALGRLLHLPARVDASGGGAMPPPHPADDEDLVRLADRREPRPCPGFREVSDLRDHQLGQPLALDDRTRGQPRQHTWRHDVDDVPGRMKRHADQLQQDDPGQEDTDEDTDLHQRQRHRQPEIINLVQSLFDAPDIGVRGQIHAGPTPLTETGHIQTSTAPLLIRIR
jgi:hypothetical protein